MKDVRIWTGMLVAAMLSGCATAPSQPATTGHQDQAAATAPYLAIAIGDDGRYEWNHRQWQVGDLQTALQREHRVRPFNEIRLVDNGKTMTIANMIEVGALARAVGTRAYYQTGDGFKEIVFVE